MEQPTWIKYILFPFSMLYGVIMRIRNAAFDRGYLPSMAPPQWTISVGNLTVGGTGKTPVTEYLARLLKDTFPLAILSRGYGRNTRGFILADEMANAGRIGDEPYQYYQKFGPDIAVAVCEKRIEGALKLAELFPEKRTLLLDDAYQHRAIKRNVNLLLNDYSRPFYEDLPFPAGRLREGRYGARRADAVVVTKCPAQLQDQERTRIQLALAPYIKRNTPVFFAGIKYAPARLLSLQEHEIVDVMVVAGIANPGPFLTEMNQKFKVVGQKLYPDHHNYTDVDIKELIQNLKNDTFVVTTEKDIVKLKPLAVGTALYERLAYVPIEIDLGKDQESFERWILAKVNQV
ncbi:tetraacyldisaccharide 4'-kinase [Dyadobacter tibetensis]|uniref:tetraacyldisaccharide 4'-kinase n=1 Tax=Dyadobacter tibetensis TaxID=1211851 RepID=UPI00046F44B8|nr:tetraacyldisaccharide 4'-kinase [Dyadobacter tibetensis]